MTDSEHFRRLERMYAGAPMNAGFEPVLTIDEGRAAIAFPVRRHFLHAAGAVHGSVLFKALDDAGSAEARIVDAGRLAGRGTGSFLASEISYAEEIGYA